MIYRWNQADGNPIPTTRLVKLDEVTSHGGAGETFVQTIGKQAMKAVAKFVKQGARFFQADQGRGVGCWFGEVADIDNHGGYRLSAQTTLFPVRAHPGAPPL